MKAITVEETTSRLEQSCISLTCTPLAVRLEGSNHGKFHAWNFELSGMLRMVATASKTLTVTSYNKFGCICAPSSAELRKERIVALTQKLLVTGAYLNRLMCPCRRRW